MTELKPRQLDIMQKLTLMLERKGPVNITTALLAKECGITEAAIYRHFPSKRKIYSGLVDFCEKNLFDLISKINTDIGLIEIYEMSTKPGQEQQKKIDSRDYIERKMLGNKYKHLLEQS